MPAEIVVDNVYSKLIDAPPEFLAHLYSQMSIFQPKARHSHKFKTHVWDGYTHLFSVVSKKFPTGLLPIVRANLKSKCIPYTITDLRKEPDYFIQYQLDNTLTLRDYQKEAIDRSISHKRGVLWLAMNAGKTLIAAGIIYKLGYRALYIVHDKDLLAQVVKDMRQYLHIEPGVLGGGIYKPGDVVIASNQTLSLFLRDVQEHKKKDGKPKLSRDKLKIIAKVFDNVDILFLDECHLATAPEWYKAVKHCDAMYRIGLSGTAFTKNSDRIRDAYLVAATGDTLMRITTKDMVKKGYSTLPVIYIHQHHTPYVPINDYSLVERWGIVENIKRNKLIAKIAARDMQNGHVVLILVNKKDHGNAIQEILEKKYEIESIFATGELSIKTRNAIVQGMKTKKIPIVISTIFKRGMNIPSLSSLILTQGEKSEASILQAYGRPLRKEDGKEKALIHDIYDIGNKFLEEHAKSRLRTWKGEGFGVKVIPEREDQGDETD